MKTTFKISIILITLGIVSCKEPSEMLTVINADGSCYRILKEDAGVDFLLGKNKKNQNPFPVDIDSTWDISWIYKNTGIRTDFPLTPKVLNSLNIGKETTKPEWLKSKSNVSVFIRKNFENPEQMDALFKLKKQHSWSNLNVKHKLDKKFRWFYTYYRYSETYPKIKIQVEIPITKYLANNEIMFWFTGQPDILKGMNGIEARDSLGKLEDKYNLWFTLNSWEAQYKAIIANYEQIKSPPVSSKTFSELKDSIFNSKAKNNPDFKMEKVLKEFFKSNAYSVLWQNENSPMKKFENEYYGQTMQYLENSFTYKLIMPGTITNAGNSVLHGDTLSWRLTAYRFFPDNYIIQAESRKANIWAFILTGIILLITIGSFVWKGKK